jgi:hypothetical protein
MEGSSLILSREHSLLALKVCYSRDVIAAILERSYRDSSIR